MTTTNTTTKRVGKEFWRWFYKNSNHETIEDAIERITGVKDPKSVVRKNRKAQLFPKRKGLNQEQYNKNSVLYEKYNRNIHIYPVDRKNKQDKKNAKLMKKFLNHEWKRYGDIVTSIISARNFIEGAYALQTPDRIWDRIMEAVVRSDIKEYETQ